MEASWLEENVPIGAILFLYLVPLGLDCCMVIGSTGRHLHPDSHAPASRGARGDCNPRITRSSRLNSRPTNWVPSGWRKRASGGQRPDFARKANIDLDFNKAAAIDLLGGTFLAVQTSASCDSDAERPSASDESG